jgi:hypothetical protein
MWCKGIGDELLYPYKYNDYCKDSHRVMPKRSNEPEMQRVVYGMTNTTTRTFAYAQKRGDAQ